MSWYCSDGCGDAFVEGFNYICVEQLIWLIISINYYIIIWYISGLFATVRRLLGRLQLPRYDAYIYARARSILRDCMNKRPQVWNKNLNQHENRAVYIKL